MTQAPVRPRYRPLPEGFVDAIGLDDDAIGITPFIVGAAAPTAETASDGSEAGRERRPRRRRARASMPVRARNHDLVMDK